MAGSIITIEGLDGAGKSTQIEMLVKKLNEEGVKHKFIHFPMLNNGFYGSLIAEYLRGEFGAVDIVHPKLVALLFAEDRKEHLTQLLRWIADDNLIIMDRYVNSNIAFQCAKTIDETEKRNLKKWILDFEFRINQLPVPDLSFFLDVPLDIVTKSLDSNRIGEDRSYLNGKVDIHEDSLPLQKNVYEEYKILIEEQNNFHRISCFSEDGNWFSRERIHQQILEDIKTLNPQLYGNIKIFAK